MKMRLSPGKEAARQKLNLYKAIFRVNIIQNINWIFDGSGARAASTRLLNITTGRRCGHSSPVIAHVKRECVSSSAPMPDRNRITCVWKKMGGFSARVFEGRLIGQQE